MSTLGDEMHKLAQQGHLTRDVQELAQNKTFLAEQNVGVVVCPKSGRFFVIVLALLTWLWT